jgi:hypothetical protein
MKKVFENVLRAVVIMLVAGCVLGLTTQPLSAQVTIPSGSTITSAVFSIYVYTPTGRPVTVHRITAEWGETTVTYNSFNNSYDPAVLGGFTADAVGWKSVDITFLVQAWAAGLYPNYGIALLEAQQWIDSAFTNYYSSDYPYDPTLRPKLVIGYTPPGGAPTSVTIQRPGTTAEQVVDTFVNALPADADLNYGTEWNLLTRFYGEYTKYSLVRFIYTYTPPTSCPGTGTPGYWMNHPEAWPTDYDSIIIGGLTYTKEQAIALMFMPTSRDVTYIMFQALVAAKLNAAIGCPTACPGADIGATIAAADAWMWLHPVGSGVRAGGPTSPWRQGEPLYFLLDQYNNGLLCVPHRD